MLLTSCRRLLLQSVHFLPLLVFLLAFSYLPRSVATDEEALFHWEPDYYPSPFNKLTAKHCTGQSRNPPSSICDPEGMLNRTEAIELDKLIDREPRVNTTSCLCPPCPPNRRGLSIKVAILQFIQQRSNQTFDETLHHFADRTRSNWNYSPKCGADVLIFLMTSHPAVYLSLGAKAERVVGTDEGKEMVEKAIPDFRSGRRYIGLAGIIRALRHSEEVYDPRLDRLGLKQGLLITIAGALGSLVLIVLGVWFCIQRESSRSKKRKIATTGNGAKQSNGHSMGEYAPVKELEEA